MIIFLQQMMPDREEVRATQIESERITNIAELEKIIQDARVDVACLKNAINREDNQVASHLAEQLDLKLHQMKVFNFSVERRTVTVGD